MTLGSVVPPLISNVPLSYRTNECTDRKDGPDIGNTATPIVGYIYQDSSRAGYAG